MFATFPSTHTNPHPRLPGWERDTLQEAAIRAEQAVHHVETLERAESNPARKQRLRRLARKLRRRARKAAGFAPPHHKAVKKVAQKVAQKRSGLLQRALRVQRPKPPVKSFQPKPGAAMSQMQAHAMQVERLGRTYRPELAGVSAQSIGLDHYGMALQNAGAILNGLFDEDSYGSMTDRVRRRQHRRTKALAKGVGVAKKAKAGSKKRRSIRKDLRGKRRAMLKSI